MIFLFATLSVLFLMGLGATQAFLHTWYGRLVVKTVKVLLDWSIHHWWRVSLVVFVNHILTLALLCASAFVPAGALILAPLLGVHTGIIGRTISLPEDRVLLQVPSFLFFLAVVMIFILESTVLGFSAIMAASQSLAMDWDPYRAIGLWQVVAPIGLWVLALCAFLEGFVARCEPRLVEHSELV